MAALPFGITFFPEIGALFAHVIDVSPFVHCTFDTQRRETYTCGVGEVVFEAAFAGFFRGHVSLFDHLDSFFVFFHAFV
jgi:hypothetical protein